MSRMKCTQDKCVSCTILKFFEVTKASKSPIYPTDLYESLKKKSPKFQNILNGKVQDAHEFLLLVAEEMESKQHSLKWFGNNFIADVRTIVQCSLCKNMFKSDGHFGDFTVNIYGKSVQNALDMYFEWENVDSYDCPCCKKKVAAKKKFSLISTPPCLCITLNRFTKNSKINRKIDIRTEITTSDYFYAKSNDASRPQCKYKLVAVINHLGKLLNSGHYTAVIHSQKNDFYEFNDSIVHKVNKQAIKGNEAYILFYERTEDGCESIAKKSNGKFPNDEHKVHKYSGRRSHDFNSRFVNNVEITKGECSSIEIEIAEEDGLIQENEQNADFVIGEWAPIDIELFEDQVEPGKPSYVEHKVQFFRPEISSNGERTQIAVNGELHNEMRQDRSHSKVKFALVF